jgi:hypothetical protein
MGLKIDTLQRIERPGLISELLNDLMVQRDIQDLLSGGQIAFFPKDSLGRFRYVNGFSVNTQLFQRFILRVERGRVIGPGGGSHNRVFHSGKRRNFMKRLERSFREVERKVGSTATAVKSIMPSILIPNPWYGRNRKEFNGKKGTDLFCIVKLYVKNSSVPFL